MIDALLNDWFPNYVPGELDDTLDLPRFFRMVQAKNVMVAEDERARYFKDGKLTTPDKNASDATKARYRELLQTWTEHDRLIAEIEEAGG